MNKFSRELVNTQQLLFGKLPPVAKGEFEFSEDFYTQGYTLIDNVKDFIEAEQKIREGIGSVDTNRLPMLESLKNRIELAKVDAIPECGDSVDAKCQALHFDLGQPFVHKNEDQQLYAVIGLYLPPEQPTMAAQTRVLPLETLPLPKLDLSKEEIEQRINDYVEQAGDGWSEPFPVNTGRLTVVARILDAVYQKNDLHDMFNQTMAEWFDNACGKIQSEEEYFKSCGIDLAKHEKRVILQPGQLLVIDNLRCGHGRVGDRYRNEIFQFMYGVNSVKKEEVDAFRSWIVSLFDR